MMDNEKRTIQPIRIKSNQLISKITEIAEGMDGWMPLWFVCDTFKFGTTRANAIKQWLRYVKRVVNDTGAHIVPIAAIDLDDKGRVHIHAVLMTDRYIKAKAVHSNWKCGYEWSRLYQTGKRGIPYILNHHDYIPVTKPFCPHRKKCRGKKGCRALRTNWNVVNQAVNVPARGVSRADAPSVDSNSSSLSAPSTNVKTTNHRISASSALEQARIHQSSERRN